MDSILTTIQADLTTGTRVELYSSQTQSLLGSKDVVLWNQTLAVMSDSTYAEFKQAMAKRYIRNYRLTSMLPYHDLCIALLCCTDYTLNQTTLLNSSHSMFKSAWRNITVVSGTATSAVRSWIETRLYGRSSYKFTMAVQDTDKSVNTVERSSPHVYKHDLWSTIDRDLSSACRFFSVSEYAYTTSEYPSVMKQVNRTPECQLDDLRIMHQVHP